MAAYLQRVNVTLADINTPARMALSRARAEELATDVKRNCELATMLFGPQGILVRGLLIGRKGI